MSSSRSLPADLAPKYGELRQRFVFLLGALIVYRVGAHIPVPGIDPRAMAQLFNQQSGTILDMVNMFSGGALKRLSVFALGIMPYISASIIIQLLTLIAPKLEQIKKEGESGRRRLNQYTRYATVLLASFQSVGVALALQNQSANGMSIVVNPGMGFVFLTAVTLVTGTMFLMWLGEQITERGIGNGISIIIFSGIVAGLPPAIGSTLEIVRTGEMSPLVAILLFFLIVVITGLVVYLERGQRRIVITYPKRQQGRHVVNAQNTFLPLKLNMSGVIPPIFASSIMLFPGTLSSWFSSVESVAWLRDISVMLSPGQPAYVIFYAVAIVFFSFFYTAVVFNAKETSENLKKSGAIVPGLRPGEQTAAFLDDVVTRLTVIGSIYIASICLLPEILIVYWNVPFYFGGTSLLIIVVVVMELITQIQSHMISHQYSDILKKSRLNSGNR